MPWSSWVLWHFRQMSKHLSINSAEKQDHQLINCHENLKTCINWISLESECALSFNCPTQKNTMEVQSLDKSQTAVKCGTFYLCFSSHYISTYSFAAHNVAITELCTWSKILCLSSHLSRGQKERKGGKTMNKNTLFFVTIFLCHVRSPILHFSI